jgi:F-type H+-transporting ATPase subunit b
MESPSLISPNLATFALTIVNIGILCFLLRAILFKPVSKFVAERAKKIQDAINQADEEKKQAKQLLVQYEEKLKSAEIEAGEIIKTARENANREAQRITAEGKNAAEMLMANGRRQLALDHEAALQKFKAEAVLLIMAASSKLIGRDFQKDDNSHFVTMLLEELAAERAAQKGNR